MEDYVSLEFAVLVSESGSLEITFPRFCFMADRNSSLDFCQGFTAPKKPVLELFTQIIAPQGRK